MPELGSLGAVASPISVGWKWAAIGIALGAVVLLFGAAAFFGPRKPGSRRGFSNLFEGADGISSTSKFQWLIWLVSILFSYIALWVLRAKQGDWGAVQNVPQNVLIVLGLSTVTMATAKGVTSAYVQGNRITKSSTRAPIAEPGTSSSEAPASSAAPSGQPNGSVPASPGGLLVDDSGVPELAKIQMIGFTFVAVGIFLATVIHEIVDGNAAGLSLPDIDGTLLALMGISQGGYLAKKVVTMTPS